MQPKVRSVRTNRQTGYLRPVLIKPRRSNCVECSSGVAGPRHLRGWSSVGLGTLGKVFDQYRIRQPCFHSTVWLSGRTGRIPLPFAAPLRSNAETGRIGFAEAEAPNSSIGAILPPKNSSIMHIPGADAIAYFGGLLNSGRLGTSLKQPPLSRKDGRDNWHDERNNRISLRLRHT